MQLQEMMRAYARLVRQARQSGKPVFEVANQPHTVDTGLRPLPDHAPAADARYLAVSVRNTSYEAFDRDLVLDISDCGRDALADHGVLVRDSWTPGALRATGQEVFGRGVNLPPLKVGEQVTLYFQVDSTDARAGTPDVEFVLLDARAMDKRVRADHSNVHPVAITGQSSGAGPGTTPPRVTPVPGSDVMRVPLDGAGTASATGTGTNPAEQGVEQWRFFPWGDR